MSLKKNISGGPLDVPLLGRAVADGEVCEVPDFQPAHTDAEPLPITWPADKWQDVTAIGSGDADADGGASHEGM